MPASRVALALLLLGALPSSLSCGERAVCGDGVVGPGEDELTCCLDTGCAFGSCDEATRRCFEPWWLACGGSEGCLDDGPHVCRNPAPPAYDCASCGCPDDGRCEDGVCWSLDEVRARRDDAEVATDLLLGEYFGLVDELMRAPLTLDELVGEVRASAQLDRRRSVTLLGLVSASSRERALADRLLGALDDAGLEHVEQVSLLDDESAADDACSSVEGLAAAHLADEGRSAVLAEATLAHRETCFYPDLFSRCGPPTLDGCVLRADRQPLGLVLIDFAAALDVTDRALLIRSTNRPAGERVFHLDEAITTWRERVETWPQPPDHDVTLEGDTVTLRAQRSQRYDATWWVSLGARGKPPWGLLGYRLLWSDGATQSFLVEHDLVGRHCSWSVEDEGVRYGCAAGGAMVSALIDPATQSLTSIERSAP